LLEPLGQSLVLPAIRGLADRGMDITLMTFEKSHDLARAADVQALRATLVALGVSWTPLRYHKWPTVPATAFDVAQGIARSLWARRLGRFDLIHARTFVGGLIGWALRPWLRASLVYHGEGFWPDQQVEGGVWRAGSRIYRVCKAVDSALCTGADGLVLLSRRSLPVVEALPRGRRHAPPIAIVPSCVDLDHFPAPSASRPGGPPRLVYIGSLGNRYPVEPLGRFLRAVQRYEPSATLTVLSQSEPDMVRRCVQSTGVAAGAWSLGRAPHAEIPSRLAECHAGLFFLRQGPGAESCSPTKVGEYWASGLPVVTTPGAGDTDEAIRQHRVGVILGDLSAESHDRAARELLELLRDPDLPARCRRAAEEHYSLARGIDAQMRLYETLLRGSRPSDPGA
jgi:glycosyltransferase involved in cell wall biosynthesis